MWIVNPLLRVKTVSPCRRSCYIPTGDILAVSLSKNIVFELHSWLIDLLGVKWFNRERHRRKEGEDRWRERRTAPLRDPSVDGIKALLVKASLLEDENVNS